MLKLGFNDNVLKSIVENHSIIFISTKYLLKNMFEPIINNNLLNLVNISMSLLVEQNVSHLLITNISEHYQTNITMLHSPLKMLQKIAF